VGEGDKDALPEPVLDAHGAGINGHWPPHLLIKPKTEQGKYRPVTGQTMFMIGIRCGCAISSAAVIAAVTNPSASESHAITVSQTSMRSSGYEY
jgi:hypothetical protein